MFSFFDIPRDADGGRVTANITTFGLLAVRRRTR
jgi:hypothetical protein